MIMNDYISNFFAEQGYCNGACNRFMALLGGWPDIGARMRWPHRSIPPAAAERARPAGRGLVPEFMVLCNSGGHA
jgi:hypothetical protein